MLLNKDHWTWSYPRLFEWEQESKNFNSAICATSHLYDIRTWHIGISVYRMLDVSSDKVFQHYFFLFQSEIFSVNEVEPATQHLGYVKLQLANWIRVGPHSLTFPNLLHFRWYLAIGDGLRAPWDWSQRIR